jgi:hypothetical protein
MKKLLVVLGLLVLVPGLAFAQGTYYVDYYANNAGPSGAFDQSISFINVGTLGTPPTSPVGDICVIGYVFNADQEMIECCAGRLSPNQLATAFVGANFTSNPLTSVVPTSGVIKIVLTPPPTGGCDPTAPLTGTDASLAVVTVAHLQEPGVALFVTETEKHHQILGADEAAFLPQACSFTLFVGSGKGQCTLPGNTPTSIGPSPS